MKVENFRVLEHLEANMSKAWLLGRRDPERVGAHLSLCSGSTSFFPLKLWNSLSFLPPFVSPGFTIAERANFSDSLLPQLLNFEVPVLKN